MLAPGEIVVLYGSGLGPTQLVKATVGNDGYYPKQLAGTAVSFDGLPASMIYSSATQVGTIVPYGINGTAARVTVTYQGQSTAAFSVPVAPSAPGIFSLDSTGRGQAAAINQDGFTLNTAATPAKVGEVVSLYATGEGQTTPAGVDGKPAAVPLPHPNLPVSVTIGGQNVAPQYAGGAPGQVAGLMQINVRIPEGVAVGSSVPVFLSVGGRTSQAGITIAIASDSPTVPASFSSTSLSPLTPLYIQTRGLDSSAPVTIQFSNIAGFSLTARPLRVQPDGTVVVATPIYLDPASHAIGAGTVSVVLAQNGRKTAPVSVNIGDLPSQDSYGVQLGEISHAFLVYEALVITRRINELQAYQALPGHRVDTSKAQASLKRLRNAVLRARMDVDYVSRNSKLTIAGGTISNKFRIQFDKNSLSVMDRILGFYLSQLQPVISSVIKLRGSEAATMMSSPNPRVRARLMTPLHKEATVGPLQGKNLKTVFDIIDAATNQINLQQAISDYYNSDSTIADKAIAVAGGLGSLYNQITLGAEGPTAVFGNVYGAAVASFALLNNLTMELTDATFIVSSWFVDRDSTAVNAALGDIIDRGNASWSAWKDTELNLLSLASGFGSFGREFKAALDSDVSQGILKSADLLQAVAECASNSCYSDLFTNSIESGTDTAALLESGSQGVAVVSGTAQGSNPFGLVLDQNEIQLSSRGVSFNSLADENGNYLMFVPLGTDSFQYNAADLQIIDPTGTNHGAQVIDLSQLTTKDLLELPVIYVSIDCEKAELVCSHQCDEVWPSTSLDSINANSVCTGACLVEFVHCIFSEGGLRR